MTPILADVNLWLATLVTEHPHHRAATRWWRDDVVPAGHRPGFCRLTQLGVLRLLSNERVMGPRCLDHSRAWEVVTRVTAQRGVSFLPEPAGIDEHLAGACRSGRFSTGFWTDAYLAAFARAGRYRLATFDRGFRRFDGLDLILLAGRAPRPSARGPCGPAAGAAPLDPHRRSSPLGPDWGEMIAPAGAYRRGPLEDRRRDIHIAT